MPMNIAHRTRTTLATVGYVGAIGLGGLGGPARAEPVVDPAHAQTLAGAVNTHHGSANVESPALDSSDLEGRTFNAGGAQAAPDVLVRDRPWIPSYSRRTDRSMLATDTPAMTPGDSAAVVSTANEDLEWRRELAGNILDAVRPAYEGLAGAGILDAVRSVDSELGLLKNWSAKDVLSGNHSQGVDVDGHPESVVWTDSGARSDLLNRPRSAAQTAQDHMNASIMMEKLVEEVRPWVLALLAVYVIGYMVRFSLNYSHWKAARQRRRRRGSSATSTGHAGHTDPKGHTGRKRHRRPRRRPTL